MSQKRNISEVYPEMNYYMNEYKSDITFIIDGQRIPAIKSLLSLKSEVFERMFCGDFRESNDKEIEIKDTNPEAFKVMLKWIYCEPMTFKPDIDYEMAINVYHLGHKYQLMRLMNTIERKLTEMISIDNFEVIHKFGSYYSLNDLLKSIEELIDKNPNAIIEKDMNNVFEDKLAKYIANKYKQSLIQINSLNFKCNQSLAQINRFNNKVKQLEKTNNNYRKIQKDYKRVKSFLSSEECVSFHINGEHFQYRERCRQLNTCPKLIFKY